MDTFLGSRSVEALSLQMVLYARNFQTVFLWAIFDHLETYLPTNPNSKQWYSQVQKDFPECFF